VTKQIFINLPVADLGHATAFYESVGATRNPMFSGETASCMVFSDAIHVMLLTHAFFGTFTAKPVSDAKATCEVLLCISAESRAVVDQMVERAGSGGGVIDPCSRQDHGFMYGRSFEDPDGHTWEVMWMDLEAARSAMAKAGPAPT
jgi:predicted lactoylglutathione lyase